MRFTLVILIFAGSSVPADTQIHRCLLEDGTFAFQETPCPEPEATSDDDGEVGENSRDYGTQAKGDDVFDFVNPYDEPASPPTPVEQTRAKLLTEDRAECEKTTREDIDAIDLEMRESDYSNEQGQEYLAELLDLTRQLRACKQL